MLKGNFTIGKNSLIWDLRAGTVVKSVHRSCRGPGIKYPFLASSGTWIPVHKSPHRQTGRHTHART